MQRQEVCRAHPSMGCNCSKTLEPMDHSPPPQMTAGRMAPVSVMVTGGSTELNQAENSSGSCRACLGHRGLCQLPQLTRPQGQSLESLFTGYPLSVPYSLHLL